jgi:hypothetical protein
VTTRLVLVGLTLAGTGALAAVAAIMAVFIGHGSAELGLLLEVLVAGLAPVLAIAAWSSWRHRWRGIRSGLARCPGWFWVGVCLLLVIAALGWLSIWLIAVAGGPPTPPRFHYPVAALAAYTGAFCLLTGLALHDRPASIGVRET